MPNDTFTRVSVVRQRKVKGAVNRSHRYPNALLIKNTGLRVEEPDHEPREEDGGHHPCADAALAGVKVPSRPLGVIVRHAGRDPIPEPRQRLEFPLVEVPQEELANTGEMRGVRLPKA